MAGDQLSRPLVIFDFDWSLINENSDSWIMGQLRPSADLLGQMERLQHEDPDCNASWTHLMDTMMQRMAKAGVSRQELADALVQIPCFPDMLEVARLCHQRGCELVVVSDANDFFIDAILTHHGLRQLFSEVHTNPAAFESVGGKPVEGDGAGDPAEAAHEALRVRPYVPAATPHGCPRCPVNMCKGAIVSRLLKSRRGVSTIYVGDGFGDLCGCLALSHGDWACARDGCALKRHLEKEANKAALKASVLPWSTGTDVLEFAKQRVADCPDS